jgi:hypothetical protein
MQAVKRARVKICSEQYGKKTKMQGKSAPNCRLQRAKNESRQRDVAPTAPRLGDLLL